MLKGSYVALVTPFHTDGRINYSKLEELIEYHIKYDTDGIVVLGTTGEASTISFENQMEIVKFTVSKVNHRIPVMAGAGSNDTAEAIKKAETFSSFGVDYLLVITPYYNKTNESGLLKHFKMISSASTCPIVLYNVPSRTGMSISLRVLKELAKEENIVGIKEASGDISYAMKVSALCNDSFVMFAGNDDCIVPYMSVGACGVISVLANLCPQAVHDLCVLCLKQDFPNAIKKAHKLLDLIQALFLETNPIPIKEAMNYFDFQVGGFRFPLDAMSRENKNILIHKLEEAKGEISI